MNHTERESTYGVHSCGSGRRDWQKLGVERVGRKAVVSVDDVMVVLFVDLFLPVMLMWRPHLPKSRFEVDVVGPHLLRAQVTNEIEANGSIKKQKLS